VQGALVTIYDLQDPNYSFRNFGFYFGENLEGGYIGRVRFETI
jgi:hypothetical protein